ncbi:hypothetical protein BD769DRAFT_1681353 [Suillus cothurnatus]|nr:hypothetical protein BD769DRAFT_1681353 [Suillus cothurnatus]
MSGSPPQKLLRQCIHVGSDVMLNFQLSVIHNQRSSSIDELHNTDCKEFLQIKEVVPKGTQTAGKDEEPQGGVESELRRVKEQLENAESVIANLSERVNTYRDRWLEEYYRADNLERHMPYETYVPELGQIPEGIASPAFFPEFFTWNEEREEWGDDKLLEQQGTSENTTPGGGEDYRAERNLLAGNEAHDGEKQVVNSEHRTKDEADDDDGPSDVQINAEDTSGSVPPSKDPARSAYSVELDDHDDDEGTLQAHLVSLSKMILDVLLIGVSLIGRRGTSSVSF